MTKRLCNQQTDEVRCNKKFHTRDKNRSKCRKHCGNGNRPNRSLK